MLQCLALGYAAILLTCLVNRNKERRQIRLRFIISNSCWNRVSDAFHGTQTVTTEENLGWIFMAKRTAIVQPNHPKIPDCDGGTSTIDRASEQQLTEACLVI